MDLHTDTFPIAYVGKTHVPPVLRLGRLKISFEPLAPAVFDRIEFIKFLNSVRSTAELHWV